jgi:hypothetical protein
MVFEPFPFRKLSLNGQLNKIHILGAWFAVGNEAFISKIVIKAIDGVLCNTKREQCTRQYSLLAHKDRGRIYCG